MHRYILITLCFLLSLTVFGQSNGTITGRIKSEGLALEFVNIGIPRLNKGTASDSKGYFEIKNIPFGTYQLQVSRIGYQTFKKEIVINNATPVVINVELIAEESALNEVVITGTMKEVSRAESAVPVEIITPTLFRKNPSPSLFEAIGMVNGVKPQINCNVCNTGDIHINGMEGPYSMILIDGMPIVSALATVYGLNGIPNSLVERIEVVKGPASSLYGSEAMGGIINVITKNPSKAPLFSADVFGTSWAELSADAALKLNVGEKTAGLLGINYFNYQNPIDKNKDGFTDVTLQNRISIFNKWNFLRKDHKLASLAARYVYEGRWGGEMNWNKSWRGSDVVYGESIYTKRAEIIGLYQLPFREKVYTQFSYNWHDQNSWYGQTPYMANQQIVFVQAYWDKNLGKEHNFLLGSSFRYTYYDDNTVATKTPDGTSDPGRTPLPGIFVQDEWTINPKNTLLLGYRYDYEKNHGHIHSPRLAYKLAPNKNHIFRASLGTGFRVVNLFTEDHAALTGARQVVIANALNPERSYNGNLNYVLKTPIENFFLGLDITGFYSYFSNKIVGDFDTDPQKIIYDNLEGHAISRGISVNADLAFTFPLKIMAGVSLMDVYLSENKNERIRQLHAPKWSGTFTASYTLPNQYSVDFTGEWNGPMRLPILPNDYRSEYSPWHCIANVQISKKLVNGLEVYGGLKNLLNFVPKNPIMRPFDPFNKQADDPVNNPNGYTFDPSYNYASMQGLRGFLGLRYNLF